MTYWSSVSRHVSLQARHPPSGKVARRTRLPSFRSRIAGWLGTSRSGSGAENSVPYIAAAMTIGILTRLAPCGLMPHGMQASDARSGNHEIAVGFL
jgi:hypothetical protein